MPPKTCRCKMNARYSFLDPLEDQRPFTVESHIGGDGAGAIGQRRAPSRRVLLGPATVSFRASCGGTTLSKIWVVHIFRVASGISRPALPGLIRSDGGENLAVALPQRSPLGVAPSTLRWLRPGDREAEKPRGWIAGRIQLRLWSRQPQVG